MRPMRFGMRGAAAFSARCTSASRLPTRPPPPPRPAPMLIPRAYAPARTWRGWSRDLPAGVVSPAEGPRLQPRHEGSALGGAGEEAAHEVALQREEHDERDHERHERPRREALPLLPARPDHLGQSLGEWRRVL